MELINAVTCGIRKTAKYIYSTEIREYKVTRYRIRYSPKSWQCTVFHTYAEAYGRMKLDRLDGWVEQYETTETKVLHHKYKREGR